ncbi:uncharacterized protein LOC118755762 [Rhagoletis pomonella]|uniref:uncharacterized protein LOC118755762 n=1 Tax=Rhagoletis pomonella TaxID=28610 RepID=UPI001781C19A|nr:uncharacterized protein LOC118755762 [Rhagoletis pomonella]
MAALPPERSNFSLPFTYTGLDFAGPLDVKSSTLRKSPLLKGYVCVFICFSTKAIHLEPCSDLSTKAFQAGFPRFVGRRGLPQRLFSDNGKNFVGANRAFKQDFKRFLKECSDDIRSKYTLHGFDWHFLPSDAPHMGGLWEAAVKSFKLHFKRIAGSQSFTFEELATLLARIEAVLNSRPLSPMSDSPQELLALTPGHFLRGAPLLATPEPIAVDNLSLQNRWEKLKILHQQFSLRWKEEYLKELHQRYKWKAPQKNLTTIAISTISNPQDSGSVHKPAAGSVGTPVPNVFSIPSTAVLQGLPCNECRGPDPVR